jgi:hypothetical protein
MPRRPPSLVLGLLLALALPAFGADPHRPEIALLSGGSPVRLDPDTETELASSLTLFASSCHPFESVTGRTAGQSELRDLWAAQKQLTHAVLGASFDAAADQPLRGRSGEILVGLASASGPNPVIFRDQAGTHTLLIKCPGLDGLLLACQVHSFVPGMSPSPRCAEWRALHLSLPTSDPPAPLEEVTPNPSLQRTPPG